MLARPAEGQHGGAKERKARAGFNPADSARNKSLNGIFGLKCSPLLVSELIQDHTVLEEETVPRQSTLPAMQWHAHKRLFAFMSGNLAPLFLRLQYVLNVFIFRSFVKSLSMPIDSFLTTMFFLETISLPSIPTKRYESEPDLPKPKLLLPNAGRSNRHCLSIEKTSNRQRRGKLTMSSRLAGWLPRIC